MRNCGLAVEGKIVVGNIFKSLGVPRYGRLDELRSARLLIIDCDRITLVT